MNNKNSLAVTGVMLGVLENLDKLDLPESLADHIRKEFSVITIIGEIMGAEPMSLKNLANTKRVQKILADYGADPLPDHLAQALRNAYAKEQYGSNKATVENEDAEDVDVTRRGSTKGMPKSVQLAIATIEEFCTANNLTLALQIGSEECDCGDCK